MTNDTKEVSTQVTNWDQKIILVNPRNVAFLKLLERLRMEHAAFERNMGAENTPPWILPFLDTVFRTLMTEQGPTPNQIETLKTVCSLYAVQVKW